MALSTDTNPAPTTRVLPGGLREVFDLAVPVVLTQLSATTMGVVDSAMVGRLGATQLAAVGFGAIWMWTSFSLFFGTASAVQTFVSQADGAGRAHRCGAWAWQGLYAVVPVTALAALLVYPWIGSLVALLGPSLPLQQGASSYVAARLPGEVGFAVVMIYTSFFRGTGDTRTRRRARIQSGAPVPIRRRPLRTAGAGLPTIGDYDVPTRFFNTRDWLS